MFYTCLASANEQDTLSVQDQCPIITFDEIAAQYPAVLDDTIRIYSQSTAIEKDQLATFSGGVTLINKEHKIIADQLSFNRKTSGINAVKDIQYQNDGINIFAQKLNASESSQSTILDNTSYQLANNPGHGSAVQLSVNANGTLVLMDSTFTTCLGEVPDWQIKASEIKLSIKENIGQVYHARIKVFDIPVLYLPYFSFPLTNERKSGFLHPKIKSSSQSGLEIETPFYWNIAENIDATITPHYMSKRGTQLLTEIRYLSDQQSGIIDLEYLNKDSALKNNNNDRYLARFQHVGTFSDNFRAYIDYTGISDDNYLVDIGSEQYNSNDAYLYQIGELSYFSDFWQSTIKLQDFEILGEHEQSYKTLPQIEIQAQLPLSVLNGQFEIYSEFSRFENATKEQANANRYHIEAGVTLPISSPSWFLNSEFKVLQTYYQQDNIPLNSSLEKNVSRTLPKMRFHGGINLDRSMHIFKKDYTQTLEPQLQYLYVANKDQNNIGLYDTTTLQDDFDGLFRDRRHSGLDRISQANQYSWGVTSRILDSANAELLRFSIGRISYLNNTNASLDTLNANTEANVDKSAFAANLFFRINHQWQVNSDIQYDTRLDITNKSQINVDYQFDKNNIVQLNHRYSRDVSGNNLEQLSLLTSFSLSENWKFVGRTTHDLQQKRSIETYTGLQYESCCWAVRIAYHRHINSSLDEKSLFNENRDEFNRGFVIQFIIKGLSGTQTSIGTEEMFNSSIFGYKRPYFLNN